MVGPGPLAEPRQRWRIVFSRAALPAAGASQTTSGADLQGAWRAALLASGLPVLGRSAEPPKPSLTFAAPLPPDVAGEHELADIVLTERLAAHRVRGLLAGSLPADHTLVGLHDVWLGEPPLAGQVVASDYRVTLTPSPPLPVLRDAIASILAAASLPRSRARGSGAVTYDLRPLVSDVVLADGPPPGLRMRLRHDPERGRGRPEEVVAAISEACGSPLAIATLVRERVLLRGEAVALRPGEGPLNQPGLRGRLLPPVAGP